MADHYETLNVSRDASQEDIKAAYQALAQQLHPDRAGGDTQAFARLSEAYRVLRDPEKRRRYDLGLDETELSDAELALLEVFAEIINRDLQKPGHHDAANIVATARQLLTRYMQEQQACVAEAGRRLERLEKMLSGRVQAEGADLYQHALDQQAAKLRHERDGMERRRQALGEALELLDNGYRENASRPAGWSAGWSLDSRA